MKIIPVEEVDGASLIEFDRFTDDRGYFQEMYSTAKDYPHFTGTSRQTNVSVSAKNVVRGLHVAPFAKLCCCLRGRLYDVIADVRPNSKTYKNWYGVWLDEKSNKQLFVPKGCAHGFYSAEDDTMLMYMQDGTYNPYYEYEVNWKDSQIGVKWPQADRYILSHKDQMAKSLKDLYS